MGTSNQYVKLREERFVKKGKKLSDTIQKNILSSFEPGQKSINKTSINIKKMLKTQGEIQRNFGTTRSRCFTFYDFTTFSHLISVVPAFYLTEI